APAGAVAAVAGGEGLAATRSDGDARRSDGDAKAGAKSDAESDSAGGATCNRRKTAMWVSASRMPALTPASHRQRCRRERALRRNEAVPPPRHAAGTPCLGRGAQARPATSMKVNVDGVSRISKNGQFHACKAKLPWNVPTIGRSAARKIQHGANVPEGERFSPICGSPTGAIVTEAPCLAAMPSHARPPASAPNRGRPQPAATAAGVERQVQAQTPPPCTSTRTKASNDEASRTPKSAQSCACKTQPLGNVPNIGRSKARKMQRAANAPQSERF